MTPTRERLIEVLDYDPATGIFVWKPRTDTKLSWTRKNAGKIAGSPHSGGYTAISIDKTKYLAHRLAWLFVYGEWPDQFIDHKNLNKKDNRIDNLRLVDFVENSINTSLRSNNTSGHRGVYFEKRRKRWIVYIQKSGVKRQYGAFREKHLAVAAHTQAAQKVYGDFCPHYVLDATSG